MFFIFLKYHLLKILDKFPYRTSFGLSLVDKIKIIYYWKIGQKKYPQKCICGGKVYTRGIPPEGWETACTRCQMLFDED